MNTLLTKKIQQLERELKLAKAALATEIDDTHLPEFKKKYNGTYWKCKNSYGGDSKPWIMYIYFEEVTEVYQIHNGELTAIAKGYKMQMDSNGGISVDLDNHMYVHSYDTPCTKKEFHAAYNKIATAFENLKG